MRLNEVLTKQDEQTLSEQGYKVVDDKQLGNYGLFLVKIPSPINDMIGANYQLGLNKGETNFTDYLQHKKKFVSFGEKFDHSLLPKIVDQITRWIQQYGSVIVSSSDKQKTKTYGKVLQRYNKDFNIDYKEVAGQFYFIIS